jgi:hypothetical protein
VKHRFLATDSGKSRLIYVDQFHPEKDWSAKTPPGPRDIRLVDGNKVLISHRKGAAEYDLKTGKQTWLLDSYSGIESTLRLPNGNTLLGGNTPKGIVLIEVDAAGKEVRKVLVEGKHDIHLMHRLENGNLLLSHNEPPYPKTFWVLEVTPQGKVAWEAAIPGPADDVERLKDGNTLAPTGDKCTIVEVSKDGKIVATLAGEAAHPKVGIKWLASVEVLKNGNIVATNWLGHGVGPVGPHLIEFDRKNRIVWTWTDHERAQMIHNSLVLE